MADQEEPQTRQTTTPLTFETSQNQAFTICTGPEFEARPGEPVMPAGGDHYTVSAGIVPVSSDPALASGTPVSSEPAGVAPKAQPVEVSLSNSWTVGPLLTGPGAAGGDGA